MLGSLMRRIRRGPPRCPPAATDDSGPRGSKNGKGPTGTFRPRGRANGGHGSRCFEGVRFLCLRDGDRSDICRPEIGRKTACSVCPHETGGPGRGVVSVLGELRPTAGADLRNPKCGFVKSESKTGRQGECLMAGRPWSGRRALAGDSTLLLVRVGGARGSQHHGGHGN